MKNNIGTLFLLGALLLAPSGAYADYPRDYLKQTIPTFPKSDPAAPKSKCETSLNSGIVEQSNANLVTTPDNFVVYGLTEMFKDVGLTRYIVNRFSSVINDLKPDYIAAPEARAWPIFGALGFNTGLPMITIRKAGKLPRMAQLLREQYSTAYSNDQIEMIADPNLVGKTVVIIDDGISSGGTTVATIKLLEAAGMRVIHILAVVEYHYRAEGTIPEFAPWIPLTTTLFDLGEAPAVIQ